MVVKRGREEREEADEEGSLLFETREGKWRAAYKLFAFTIFAGICRIWEYRIKEIAGRRWSWSIMCMMMWEVCFGMFWILTQSLRWTILRHSPFKHHLLRRYGEEELPGVDIFVCTADPWLEPPSMVANTVISAMSYNYPSHKLSVYLSDDGGSDLTFYALLRASLFSKHWIPFCRRFNIQSRSPDAYFSQQHSGTIHQHEQEWSSIKKLYEDMKCEIESVVNNGKIPDAVRDQHKGFSEWNDKTTKQNHQPIVQIIIDGRDPNAVDDDGFRLPTLVYMAREKRPNFAHHFKAGAMNALIRVSSEISNAPIILNLDCDMSPNDADTIQEALCFFMDEKRGHQIAYVQFPQAFNNITKNDLYSNDFPVSRQIEFAGLSGHERTIYCGTGCFHRRESLSGMHFKDYKAKRDTKPKIEDKRTADELIEASKALATCTYEQDTEWGHEMGLVYGIPAEDAVTGLVISCRGWKSIYYNPEKKAFLGVAPTTFHVNLVQHKRWGEGLSQIFFSKYCPFIYGYGKISLGMQMGYSAYLLWAPMSIPTLFYVIVSSICTFHGIPLFPQLTSPWILPFLYAFLANNAYSFLEALSCGSTARAWWNAQRMKLFRRTTSYLFGFLDTISRLLNLSQTKFDVTDKTVSQDTLDRYEREVFDFGSSSIMYIIIATLALLSLFGAIGGMKRILVDVGFEGWNHLGLQTVLCVSIVILNKPVYEALFIRTDRGCLPSQVLFKSVVLASLGCYLAPLIC